MHTRDPSRDSQIESDIQGLITKSPTTEGAVDKACTKAYEAYRGELVLYCTSMLGAVSNPRADGEDIVQQAFEEFWKDLSDCRYNPDLASVRTFLYRITTARLANYWRQKRRTPVLVNLDDALDAQTLLDMNTETRVLDRERLSRVFSELERCPLLEQQIVILKFIHGHSTAEIAYILKTTKGNIYTRLSRLLDKLREVYNRDNQ